MYNKTDRDIFTTDGAILYYQLCEKKSVVQKISITTTHTLTTFRCSKISIH